MPEWVIGTEGERSIYVPSAGNTALWGPTLRVPVGPLLDERDRSVERLRHRAYDVQKEHERAVSA